MCFALSSKVLNMQIIGTVPIYRERGEQDIFDQYRIRRVAASSPVRPSYEIDKVRACSHQLRDICN